MSVVLKYGWRLVLATMMLTVVSYASLRLRFQDEGLRPPDVGTGLMLLLAGVREALTVGVLTWPTLRSRWSGTQLVCALFVAYFGVHSFATLSRALLTVPTVITLPVAAVLCAHGFLVAVVSAFIMVVVMGRMHRDAFIAESPRLHLPAGEWVWKLLLCALASVGLLLAAQILLPAGVQEFYSEAGQPPMRERLMLEVGRGLLLVAFLLPVIKMMKGGRLEAALTVASLAAVLGGVTPVIFPSALIPAHVRAFFMVRNSAANLLYGGLVGYLFSRRPGIDSPAAASTGRGRLV